MSKSSKGVFLIAATDDMLALGNKGQLIYDCRQDKRHFYEKTRRSVLIMGRKTYDSLPDGGLANRVHIVLTKDRPLIDNARLWPASYQPVIFVDDPETAIELAQDICERENYESVAVIGGEQIYKLLMPYCQSAYLTWFMNADSSNEFDALFPLEDFYAHFDTTPTFRSDVLTEGDLKFRFYEHKAKSSLSPTLSENHINKGVIVIAGLVMNPNQLLSWQVAKEDEGFAILIRLEGGNVLHIGSNDSQQVVSLLHNDFPEKEVFAKAQGVRNEVSV